jgi:hypothetical protein
MFLVKFAQGFASPIFTSPTFIFNRFKNIFMNLNGFKVIKFSKPQKTTLNNLKNGITGYQPTLLSFIFSQQIRFIC